MGDKGGIFYSPLGDLLGVYDKPDIPEPSPLPPPVEKVDVAGQEKYTKQRLKQRKGRASTILGSQTLGQAGAGKTTLG